MVKIRNADQYARRYRKRGERMAPKTRDSDYRWAGFAVDVDWRESPNRKSRAVNINDVFPPLRAGHVS